MYYRRIVSYAKVPNVLVGSPIGKCIGDRPTKRLQSCSPPLPGLLYRVLDSPLGRCICPRQVYNAARSLIYCLIKRQCTINSRRRWIRISCNSADNSAAKIYNNAPQSFYLSVCHQALAPCNLAKLNLAHLQALLESPQIQDSAPPLHRQRQRLPLPRQSHSATALHLRQSQRE